MIISIVHLIMYIYVIHIISFIYTLVNRFPEFFQPSAKRLSVYYGSK